MERRSFWTLGFRDRKRKMSGLLLGAPVTVRSCRDLIKGHRTVLPGPHRGQRASVWSSMQRPASRQPRNGNRLSGVSLGTAETPDRDGIGTPGPPKPAAALQLGHITSLASYQLREVCFLCTENHHADIHLQCTLGIFMNKNGAQTQMTSILQFTHPLPMFHAVSFTPRPINRPWPLNN